MKTEDDARANGLTRLVHAECAMHDGVFLINPDADLDGIVEAWDTDERRFMNLRGWFWTFEDAND
jgi:hypothetical protein